MSEIKELLITMGMSDTELKVYQTIIAFGFRTAGQVASKTGIPYEHVVTAADELQEKGYLKKMEMQSQQGAIYIPVAPKISISSTLSRKLSEKLKSLSENISVIWKKTQASIDTDTKELVVTVQSMISEYSEHLDNLVSSGNDSIAEWSEASQSNLIDIIHQEIVDFKSTIIDPMISLSTKLVELSQKVQDEADAAQDAITSTSENHRLSVEQAVDSIKIELGEFIDSVELLVNGRVSATNDSLEQLSDSTIKESKKGVESFREVIDENKEREIQKIQTINKSFAKDVMGKHSKANEDFLTNSNSYKDEFNALIDSSLRAVDSARDELVSQSHEVITKLNEDQHDYVTQFEDHFVSSVDAIQNEAVNELSDMLETSSSTLAKLQKDIFANLDEYQTDLSQQLDDLTSNIDNSLEQKFSEIVELITTFGSDLKQSTKSNVGDASQSILELKDFLNTFLTNIENELSDHLVSLTSSVEEELTKTIDASTKEMDASLSNNRKTIAEMDEAVISKLNDFHHAVDTLLNQTKDSLTQQLATAQQKFAEDIESSIQTYHGESESINQLQMQQMDEIAKEAEELTSDADKINDDLTQFVNSKLQETKSEKLESLKESIDANTEKMSKELTRFNEKLERELARFYENFNSRSQGLRDEVPQRIENMFIDQSDRLENFRREFERNKRFIFDFIDMILQEMEPGERSWRKKEFQTEFYEKAQRMNIDFKRFESQITNHFKTSIEDTDDIKNELLADFHRTIQDELNRLNELVESQGEDANAITSEFLNSLDSHKDNLHQGMSSNIDDTVEELSSTIRMDLLTKLEQPLESLLGKAQAIATGTEGVEEENRIIKAQNLLIEKIDDAITQLTGSLKSAFEESIKTLDSEVKSSVSKSASLVKTLENDLTANFDKQSQELEEFIDTMQTKLENLQTSVMSSLNSTVKSTGTEVSTTLESRSEEIEETVVKNTNQLENTTQTRLSEIDEALETFTSSLQSIREDTSSSTSKTISQSIKTQRESLQTTLDELESTTSKTRDDFQQTQTSLEENISNQLQTSRQEISEMVKKHLQKMQAAKNTLAEGLEDFFDKQSEIPSLRSIREKNNESFASYEKKLSKIDEKLGDDLTTRIEEFKQSYLANLEHLSSNLDEILDTFEETNANYTLDIFDQVSTQLSGFQGEILGAIESTKDNIDNIVINSIETVRTDILDPASDIINTIQESSSQFTSEMGKIVSNIEQISQDENTAIDKAETKVSEKLEENIVKEKQGWIVRSEALYGEQKTSLTTTSGQFEDKIEAATSEGEDGIKKEIAKIPDVIDETLDAAAKSMELLNEISKGTIDLDPDITDTSYLDVSSDAIIHNLNGLLNRTKSSVTIVSPTISWLDPEIIPTFKRASVRIVIDPEKVSPTDEKILQRFEDEGVSMSLRRLDRNRYRRDLDMIMASRDKEEVILSKLLDTEKPYAFISQDIYFIEKFAELFGIFQTMPEYDF